MDGPTTQSGTRRRAPGWSIVIVSILAVLAACTGETPRSPTPAEPTQTADRAGTRETSVSGSTATVSADSARSPTPPGIGKQCVDSASLVGHLTYDHTSGEGWPQLDAGTEFRKAWRVRNTGTCEWSPGYRLVYATGDMPAARMGGEPTDLEDVTPPGTTSDIAVELVAPAVAGEFLARWTLVDEAGTPFGESLPVAIRVPPEPTLTPEPTNTPAPDVTFSADATEVEPGERVTIAWEASQAEDVYFYEEGRSWQDYPVDPVGRRVVWPSRSTNYYLTVVGSDGRLSTRRVHVDVRAAPGARRFEDFSVLPEQALALGECVTIQWRTSREVDSVSIGHDDGVLWSDAPLEGRLTHCPEYLGEATYSVVARGPSGSTELKRTVEVVPPEAAPGTGPPDSRVPYIVGFSVRPRSIPVGACVRVYWQVAGSYDRVLITRGLRVILDTTDPGGEVVDCPDEAGALTYRLKVSDAAGRVATAERLIVAD